MNARSGIEIEARREGGTNVNRGKACSAPPTESVPPRAVQPRRRLTKIARRWGLVAGGVLVASALVVPTDARAASLQAVSNWGATGVPAGVSMNIYVPDKLASKPPLLVLSHYCGGTASAVFGQAQGGGLVKAADQYGFIIIVPKASGDCWDVGSTKSLTHDGGGETQAIAQMVKYAITKYQANPDRVYATGDSSGGMMTEALLAVYPDIFKGGSAFAGVPAGCWAVGNPSGGWSNECAGGNVKHTAQEWGDLVHAMYPSYMGHRPRVQLFHGDADDTIKFANHTEAIKEWTNVLGLSTDPDSTTTVTLGSHQAKRQSWKDSCGNVVLDAFTSMGGDHGPSDALFNSSFVVPFLGLDKTDAIDPGVAACGGGMGGSGGMGGGGSGNTGGSSGGGGGGGTAGASGGAPGASGSVATGGLANIAGTATTGGQPTVTPGGGAGGKAGAGGNAQGGLSSFVGGTNGASPSPTTDDGSCAYSPQGTQTPTKSWIALLLGAGFIVKRRRARTAA